MSNALDEYFMADSVSETPCALCGGKVIEFAVPNHVWNAVVRRGGPESDKEYLCITCFHKAVADFVRPVSDSTLLAMAQTAIDCRIRTGDFVPGGPQAERSRACRIVAETIQSIARGLR